MPRGRRDSDELDEDPSEADIERFGDATQKCPNCGTELFDDVELCWKCGHALESRPARSPASLVVVLVLAILIIIALVFWRVW